MNELTTSFYTNWLTEQFKLINERVTVLDENRLHVSWDFLPAAVSEDEVTYFLKAVTRNHIGHTAECFMPGLRKKLEEGHLKAVDYLFLRIHVFAHVLLHNNLDLTEAFPPDKNLFTAYEEVVCHFYALHTLHHFFDIKYLSVFMIDELLQSYISAMLKDSNLNDDMYALAPIYIDTSLALFFRSLSFIKKSCN